MKKNKTQFTINLLKTDHGYTFDSLVQGTVQPPKPKKPKNSSSKNSSNRSQMNRIAKELAIDLQPTPIIEEQPSLLPQEPSFNRNQPQIEINEQVEVENKREEDLPQCPAKWFDFQAIDKGEEGFFPEFFDAKSYKTPQLYMKYRNFMVKLYRKNPGHYLTKISCRRILRGDVNTIMKIHSFLEKKGLINFGLSKNGQYLFQPSKISKDVIPQIKLETALSHLPDYEEEKIIEPVNKELITCSLINKNFSKTYRGWCSRCQALCGVIMYKKKGEEKDQIFICLECYQNLDEKQAEGYGRTDIVKKTEEAASNKEGTKASWGFEENMRLLEFMGQEKKEWHSLKEETLNNKKTLEDIIIQFIQFPITNFQPEYEQNEPLFCSDPREPINFLKDSLYRSEYKTEKKRNLAPKHQSSANLASLLGMVCEKYKRKIDTMKKVDTILKEEEFMAQIVNPKNKEKLEEVMEERRQMSRYVESDQFNNESGKDEGLKYEQDDYQDFINSIYD